MATPQLTIGLVTWNGERYMRECLNSLVKQSFQDFIVVVLDNGSEDATTSIVREYYHHFGSRLTLLEYTENSGFAKAHNRIIRASQTPYCMVLNQDTVLDEHYLKHCMSVFEKDSQVGVVSGKILMWNFGEHDQQARYTNIIDSCGLEVFKNGKVSEKFVGKEGDQCVGIQEVFGVSGTMPVYRKKALESVVYEGMYFDEHFFSYKEDVDLAFRLRWAGWNAVVTGFAIGYHDRSAKATQTMSLKDSFHYRKSKSSLINYHSYKNHLTLLLKNMSGGLWIRFGLRIGFYELKKIIYVLVYERDTLRAFREVYKMRTTRRAQHYFIMKHRAVSSAQMAKWFS